MVDYSSVVLQNKKNLTFNYTIKIIKIIEKQLNLNLMKLKNVLFIAFFLTCLNLVPSCNEEPKEDKSIKGKWSQQDLDKATMDLEKIKGLSAFNDHHEPLKNTFLGKCEDNYSSYEEANEQGGLEKLAKECNEYILTKFSIRGHWCEADKEAFYSLMETSEALKKSDKKEEWVECYYSKCEDYYRSYYDANQDEQGCVKIAQECNSEVIFAPK